MDTKETTDTLRTWTAPRLMRLNQADGTEKHVVGFAESYEPSPAWGLGRLTCNGGTVTYSGASGAGVCGGPS